MPVKKGASLPAAESATRDTTAFSMPTRGRDVRRGHCHYDPVRHRFDFLTLQALDKISNAI